MAWDEASVPGRGISSPPGETVLLPYVTVRFSETRIGNPGAVSAVALASRNAPTLRTVFPNMLVNVVSDSCPKIGRSGSYDSFKGLEIPSPLTLAARA
jgi:hypothetical protein